MENTTAFKDFLTGPTGRLAELGLSVDKFAKACGLTRASIYYYLSGECLPSASTLLKMAGVLEVQPTQLVSLISTREPGKPKKAPTI
jgi:transcriptional regulator with XRE-family HTH domain